MFSVTFSIRNLLIATGGKLVGTPDFQSVSAIFTDTRETVPDSLFVALAGERFDAHDYLNEAVKQGAKLLCIEEAKADKLPAGVPAILVPSTVRAFQDIAHFHRITLPDVKVILLTGSCGKTSTKEALRAIFEHALGVEHVLATEANTNNQIGVPQNLLRLNKMHRIAIIEAGTNHHGELEPLSRCAEPDAAIVVSIGACHLEFLGSLSGVAMEKSKIFSHLRENGIAVIPANCSGHEILEEAVRSFRRVQFGFEDDPAGMKDISVQYRSGSLNQSEFTLKCAETGEKVVVRWPIPGRHQAGNAAAAAAAAMNFGIPLKTIAEGLVQTRLPGMRMRIAEHNGSRWINDAYNASPDSMIASLNWLAGFADQAHLTLILGDMGELGAASEPGHRAVCKLAGILFPSADFVFVGDKMTDAAQKEGLSGRMFHCAADAVGIADTILPGRIVFLKASRSTGLEVIEPK